MEIQLGRDYKMNIYSSTVEDFYVAYCHERPDSSWEVETTRSSSNPSSCIFDNPMAVHIVTANTGFVYILRL